MLLHLIVLFWVFWLQILFFCLLGERFEKKYDLTNKFYFAGNIWCLFAFLVLLMGNFFAWYGCSDKFPPDGFCFLLGLPFYFMSLLCFLIAIFYGFKGKLLSDRQALR